MNVATRVDPVKMSAFQSTPVPLLAHIALTTGGWITEEIAWAAMRADSRRRVHAALKRCERRGFLAQRTVSQYELSGEAPPIVCVWLVTNEFAAISEDPSCVRWINQTPTGKPWYPPGGWREAHLATVAAYRLCDMERITADEVLTRYEMRRAAGQSSAEGQHLPQAATTSAETSIAVEVATKRVRGRFNNIAREIVKRCTRSCELPGWACGADASLLIATEARARQVAENVEAILAERRTLAGECIRCLWCTPDAIEVDMNKPPETALWAAGEASPRCSGMKALRA